MRTQREMAVLALSAWVGTSLCATIAPRVLSTGARNELAKPEIKPPFSEAIQDTDLRKEMPYRQWNYEEWNPHYIPKACLEESDKNGLSATDFRVRTVWYNDCEAPWVVCRHNRAKETWNAILNTFSQVPVGMRQYLSNLVILPTASTEVLNAAAYTRGAVMVFMPSFFKLGVLFHEFCHILDSVALVEFVVAQGYPAGSPFSRTGLWRSAYDNDTHVPTAYARVAYQEAFADVGRWAMSHLVHRGGLADYSGGWMGVRWQVAAFRVVLGDIIFTRTGRCTGKVRSSEVMRVPVPVPGAWAKKGSAAREGYYGPEVSYFSVGDGVDFEGSRIREIVMPELAEGIVHVYQGALPAVLGY